MIAESNLRISIQVKDTGIYLVLPAEQVKSLDGIKSIILQTLSEYSVDVATAKLCILNEIGLKELENGFIVIPIERLEDISSTRFPVHGSLGGS